MKIRYKLLLPLSFILALLACDSHKPKSEWYDFTSRAYLSDSLPIQFLQRVNAVELQGIRLQRALAATTYYYEYTADHETVLKEIGTLPFAADSARADTQIRMIAGEIELRKIERLLKDESIIKDFSIDSLDGYTAYECLKTPQHHILLLSKNSDRVIHIVHQI
jgi:hypothetical protein